MHYTSSERLKKQSEFLSFKKIGKSVDCNHFVLLTIEKKNEKLSRLGIIATKRIGNAVSRNYAKRLFREIFRQNKARFYKACDILVIVRPHFKEATFEMLEKRFVKGTFKALARK